MRKSALILSLVAATLVGARTAIGVQQFQNVFMEEYIAKHKDKEFADFVKTKVKCFLCHQGKNRKNRNAYGQQLAELLDRKKDVRNVPKIKAALEKAAKMHSDPKNDKSPTFGELIASSQLPGGKLEDLQKEPKKEDDK
jgi:hypothetical protein